MRFRLLGPVEVEADDGTLTSITRRRDRCLLAILLLHHDQVVPIDRLVELLWDGDPPASARAAVHTCMSRVRAALQPLRRESGFQMITRGDGYLLHTHPDTIDAVRFRAEVEQARGAADPRERTERLRAALAMWRGPALADTASDAVRQRLCVELEELRRTAVEDRVDADLALGRHHEVIHELLGLVGEHPLRERLVAQYMLALHRCGRSVEALEVFQQLTSRLKDELGIDPGAAVRQLHVSILQNDPALTPGPDAETGATAPVRHETHAPPPRPYPGAPAQLPADAVGFTGRRDQLRELDAVLGAVDADRPETAMPVALVTGTAGVGKTALAVRWAHRARPHFPDGQLYADLRGYSPVPPVRPLDVLAQFLRALGMPPHQTPLDPEEAAAVYRTLLADRRVLIVLDNADDVERVRPLLPGSPSCLVLVTSRDSMPGLVVGHGARRVHLEPFAHADAVALLRTVVPERVATEPAAAEALTELCGGLPLALRIAAGLTATRAGATLADLVAELADGPRRLDRLEAGADPRTSPRALFSWSYRRLPEPAARMFRRLGLHPGRDLDTAAVAALDGVDTAAAARSIDLLARAHLVQDTGAGRIDLHDLLRAYAGERAAEEDTEPDRRAALTRLFDHLLAGAVAAVRACYPHQRLPPSDRIPPAGAAGPFPDGATATAWLDAERANLVSAVAHGTGHGWPEHAVALADTMATYLDRRAHHREGMTVHEHALKAARGLGDRCGEGTALHNIGQIYRRLGHYDEAIAHYQRALELRRAAGDRAGEAGSLNNLGLVHVLLARYDDALRHQQEVLAIRRAIGDRSGEGNALGNLGLTFEKLGRYQLALRHHQQALVRQREVGNQVGVAQSLDNIGVSLERLGRYEEALEHHRRALAVHREIGNRTGVALSQGNLGFVLYRLGRHDAAVDELTGAVELASDTGYRDVEAEFRNDLGRVYLSMGRTADAVTCLRRALHIGRELHSPGVQTGALNGLGQAMAGLGDVWEALDCHREALSLARTTSDRHQEARALDGMARSLLASAQPDVARRYWTEALAIYADLGVPEASEIRDRLAALNG